MYECALTHGVLCLLLYKSVYMFDVFRLISLIMPIGLFLTFGLFVVVACAMKVKDIEIILRRLMFFYCLCGLISSLLFLTYYYFPDTFRRYDVLYYLCVIFTMVVFHHFFRFAIGSGNNFNRLHYWIPVFVFIGLLVIKLVFPFFWLKVGFYMIFVFMLLWSIVYSLFPFIEMHKYSIKQVLISGTEEIINKHRTILFISEVCLYPAVFVVFPFIAGPEPGIIQSVLLIICIFIALGMNIPLAYAVIRHYTSSSGKIPLFEANRQVVVSEPSIKPTGGNGVLLNDGAGYSKQIYRKYTRKRSSTAGQLIEIDQKEFESYFRKYKPYLKPDLTLNELAVQLQSNRTYVSKFINRSYGMNFNSYINQCRLRELERLQALPVNRGKSAVALIADAGFGNYRSYLRTKKNKIQK